MFSLACVFERVGYDRLERDPFAEPMPKDPLLSISGTTDKLLAVEVAEDEDRIRSREERSLGGGSRSASSSSLEAEDRVLRTPPEEREDLLLR